MTSKRQQQAAEAVQRRRDKFKALLADVAREQGYGAVAEVVEFADKQRLQLTATLLMKREDETARMLHGLPPTVDLLRLADAVTAALPAKAHKPFEIRFVSGPDPAASANLRIAELEAQVRELARYAPQASAQPQARPARVVGGGQVVAFPGADDSQYRGLVDSGVNSHGPYVADFDRYDATGKRDPLGEFDANGRKLPPKK